MTSFKYQKSTGFRNDRLAAVVRDWCWVDDLRLEADTEGAYSSACPQGRSKPPQPCRARGGFNFWVWKILSLPWSEKMLFDGISNYPSPAISLPVMDTAFIPSGYADCAFTALAAAKVP